MINPTDRLRAGHFPLPEQTNTADPNDKRSLEEQLDPVQYRKRDEACRAFIVEGGYRERCNSMEVARLHDAFHAGWDARKVAEIREAMGLADRLGAAFR
jgi:hypothetical protein